MMDTKTEKAFALVLIELEKAKKRHPIFPCGTRAVSVITEELGELAQAVNDSMFAADYDELSTPHIMEEAAHVAVTAIRMIEHYIERDEENNYDGK